MKKENEISVLIGSNNIDSNYKCTKGIEFKERGQTLHTARSSRKVE